MKPRPDFPIQPSIVLKTSTLEAGNKYQYFWITKTDLLDEWDSVQLRMVKDWGCDKKVKDRPRVLRIPGFYHCKNKPQMVELIDINETRCSWSEVISVFPPFVEDKEWQRDNESRQDKNESKVFAVITGKDIHGESNRLEMELARYGFDTDEVEAIIRGLMLQYQPRNEEDVSRLESRMADIPRCVAGAFKALEQPEPFPEIIIEGKEFPIWALPDSMSVAVEEVARFNKIDVSVAAAAALATFSIACQKKFVIYERWGAIKHHLNIIFIIVQETGERKSVTYKIFMKPIEEYQEKLREKHTQEVKEITEDNETYKDLAKKATRKLNPEDATIDLQTVNRYKRKIRDIPARPTLILSNVTDKALTLALYENNSCMGIASPEGGMTAALFNGQYRRPGEIGANAILNGAVGDSYDYERKGSTKDNRVQITITNPSVAGILFLQRNALMPLWLNDTLRGLGFHARPHFTIGKSMKGDRGIQDEADRMGIDVKDVGMLDEEKLRPFYDRVNEVLNYEPRGVYQYTVIHMSDEVEREWVKIFDENDAKYRSVWKHRADLTNKHTSHNVQYCGLLAAYNGSMKPTVDDLRKAKVIADYYLEQKLSIDSKSNLFQDYNAARGFLEWMFDQPATRYYLFEKHGFTKTSIRDRIKGTKMEPALEAALEVLRLHRWIKLVDKHYYINFTREQAMVEIEKFIRDNE